MQNSDANEPSSFLGKLIVVGIFLAVLALGFWLRENKSPRYAPGLFPTQQQQVPVRNNR